MYTVDCLSYTKALQSLYISEVAGNGRQKAAPQYYHSANIQRPHRRLKFENITASTEILLFLLFFYFIGVRPLYINALYNSCSLTTA